MCPDLFALVNHALHDALHSLERWAHFCACADWCDSIVQSCLLFGIGKGAILDRFRPFSFSIPFKLDVGCTSGVCGRCAVSKWEAKGDAPSQISPWLVP